MKYVYATVLCLLLAAVSPANAADKNCLTIQEVISESPKYFPGSTVVKMNPIESAEFRKRLIAKVPQPTPAYDLSNVLVISAPDRMRFMFFSDGCYMGRTWLTKEMFTELMGQGV